jgi:hypothetical protein
MPLQARQYSGCVDNVRHLRPPLSARELDRQDRILDSAKTIMIRHGRTGLTIPGLANAMRLAADTIRRHFPVIDAILAHPCTNTCKTSPAPSVTRSLHPNAGTSKGQLVRPY